LANDVAIHIDRLIGTKDQLSGKVFFCNSGAEANECAIKLARKWGGVKKSGGTAGYVVVSAIGSFHGRTLATLHATGQLEKHKYFQPLPDGFIHVPFNDLSALQSVLDNRDDIAAVLLESIQGEGGVIPSEPGYLQGVRKLCDTYNVLLMMDEVQTGLGRSGKWFGFQHHDILPDVVTLAKALGNGMPVGACWARTEIADAFALGDHGSTFGGQPLAMAAALATLEVMQKEDVPRRAFEAGSKLIEQLDNVKGIVQVRGAGLLLGVVLVGHPAKQVVAAALDKGLVINAVADDTLRLAPPLLVTDQEITEAVDILREVIDG
jgi:acetylornithine/succinyldiaminopimelate/putrescine aminotransferase